MCITHSARTPPARANPPKKSSHSIRTKMYDIITLDILNILSLV